ncbi:DUF262 domain-containing protein [Devosia psychrophila]|uniref:GmrSD restriction endonucleases N-terminal domain-containing protein n=1 Tax=Devosia psychrophila TaxID=728005 RepID=A0A0F5PVP9_9HYPH|nr:DUF262 domain-containing protein [Devosia psychrophila]KKC31904.1 hypothetical protein WH91_16955 [Devosia psychrophila]SFD04535.1 Protein of unknown function DUF262 [Devosia psychrophila]
MPHASAAIELRSVARLLTDEHGGPAKYWIPAYQRGYRWTRTQVFQLLDDIRDFLRDSLGRPAGQFYCLQPLVVKKMEDGGYEVVDGQQRLTTIYVILACLENWVTELGHANFEIDYETRMRDADFLRSMDEAKADNNVDFFHIFEARRAVKDWSKDNPGQSLKLIQHLLNSDGVSPEVRVIWYELPPEEDAIAAFTRLNMGKIPLTESELVRALFLRSAAKDDASGALGMRIAFQWDRIEHSLQDNAFWYFLQSSGEAVNRITLIFNLAAKLWDRGDAGDDHAAFTHFAMAMKHEGNTEQTWKSVNDIFQALEEWYEDRYLYHVIGFILHHTPRNESTIGNLLEHSAQLSKAAFKASLRDHVLRIAFGVNPMPAAEIGAMVEQQSNEASYGNLEKVRKLLLLFNMATLLENSNSNIRFQFDSFKKEIWDVEHIRSVSDSRPDDPRAQSAWLSHCSAYLKTDKRPEAAALLSVIDAYLEMATSKSKDMSFETIDSQILSFFNEASEGGGDGLSNLTLLDSSTNRAYKNSVFAVKRNILLKNDQAGTFVPLCTRNVFLKCYSSMVGNVTFWGAEDAEAYLDAICKTLTKFLIAAEAV